MVNTGHDVEVGLVEVVAHHVPEEVVAVAGAAPVVGLEDRIASGGEDLYVVARAAEGELVG